MFCEEFLFFQLQIQLDIIIQKIMYRLITLHIFIDKIYAYLSKRRDPNCLDRKASEEGERYLQNKTALH